MVHPFDLGLSRMVGWTYKRVSRQRVAKSGAFVWHRIPGRGCTLFLKLHAGCEQDTGYHTGQGIGARRGCSSFDRTYPHFSWNCLASFASNIRPDDAHLFKVTFTLCHRAERFYGYKGFDIPPQFPCPSDFLLNQLQRYLNNQLPNFSIESC